MYFDSSHRRFRETCSLRQVRLDIRTFLPDCSRSSGNVRVKKELSHFHNKSDVDCSVTEPTYKLKNPTRENWREMSRAYRTDTPLRSYLESGNSPESNIFSGVTSRRLSVPLSCQTGLRSIPRTWDALHKINACRLCVYVGTLFQFKHSAAAYTLYITYSLNISPNIVWVIKSRRMRWAKFVARMVRGEAYTGFWWGTWRKETTWKIQA